MNTMKVALAGAAALILTAGMSNADAEMYGIVSIGDANYETQLADKGILIGAALYGSYDADYDAVLTEANFFKKAPLGKHDAGYEIILSERGEPVGTAIFGQNDADYSAYLTADDFFATAALGQYDADYDAVLASREPLGAEFFADQDEDFAALAK